MNLLVDIIDDSFVFFRFDAAGAVDETAAGFQELNRRLYDSTLLIVHSREILRSQTPSHVRASADDPGVCTRNIDQDGIECFGLERRCVLKPIDQNNRRINETEPAQIL